MVFPSLQENFPMVLLEAMDAGCAVITTDADGCAEVVGNAGIVVPRSDALSIRAAMRRLIDDPAEREALAALARSRVELFAWPRICQLYQECLVGVLVDHADTQVLRRLELVRSERRGDKRGQRAIPPAASGLV
jgi:glycosyltransferase involved in cell wall biosynthesis